MLDWKDADAVEAQAHITARRCQNSAADSGNATWFIEITPEPVAHETELIDRNPDECRKCYRARTNKEKTRQRNCSKCPNSNWNNLEIAGFRTNNRDSNTVKEQNRQ